LLTISPAPAEKAPTPNDREILMKRLAFAPLLLLALAAQTGCGGGSSAAAPSPMPPPVAATGIDTPKSVAVVTAK
jgi:hypothetical protein